MMEEVLKYPTFRRFWTLWLGGLCLFWGGSACFGAIGTERQSSFASEVGREQTTEIPIVRTVSMNIHYRIERVSRADLARVELWYGRGLTGAWQLYDYDRDMTSPVKFIAPGEGIFRFLIVATDRWGRRSCEKDGANRILTTGGAPEGTPAQMAVFIDYTAPRLYLYSPRGELFDYRQGQLQFRWAGFDSNLDAKPVRLYYQQQGSAGWTAIGNPLEAGGEFLWQIPAELEGPIIVKAALADRAGNTDVQYSGIIQLNRVRSAKGDPLKLSDPNGVQIVSDGAPIEADEGKKIAAIEPGPDSRWKQQQAAQDIQRGNLYNQRREWQEAARAFEEALNYDPSSVEARVNLAQNLVRLGRLEQAQAQYEICLQLDSSFQRALFGLAQTQITLERYAQAQKTLIKLLEVDKQDWQGWLLYGNVSEKLGRIDLARSSWQKAANDLSPVKELALEALERIRQGQP